MKINTADDCLAMALHEDRLAKQCGVGDPAYAMLVRERDWWLNEALRLEKIETADLTQLDAVELDAMVYAAKRVGDFQTQNKIAGEKTRRLGF